MSTERDIIIERLEQKLAARDKEIEKMQEMLRESIIKEIEKQFTEKLLKLRESTLEDISTKFVGKINGIMEQQKSELNALKENETRVSKIEHRLTELSSDYDGVMKELLDQKSIIQELLAKKPRKEEKIEEPAPKKEVKPPQEKQKPKGEYIIAENYTPKEKKKEQIIIEAEERVALEEDKPAERFKKPEVRKSERAKEGVEIIETPKRGR